MNEKFLSTTICILLAVAPGCSNETIDPTYDAVSASYYSVLPGSDGWQALETHADMVKASQLPGRTLRSLSTQALLDVCLQYPLLGDMMFFDDLQAGLERVAANFNGLQELISRKDVGETVLQRYQERSPEGIQADWTKAAIANYIIEISYLETILTHPDVLQSLHPAALSKLAQVSAKHTNLKFIRPAYFGRLGQTTAARLSARSLLLADPTALVQTADRDTRALDYYETTIYTPNGSPVSAYRITGDMSSYEAYQQNQHWRRTYPRATLLRTSTYRYNCHSFAWNDFSSQNTIWIDSPGDDTYWEDGSFVVSTDQYLARVSYQSDDHSAVSLGDGYFVSKWGPGPLAKHAPSYSPYSSTTLVYFIEQ